MTRKEKNILVLIFAGLFSMLMFFRSCNKTNEKVILSKYNFRQEIERAVIIGEKKVIINYEIQQKIKQLDSLNYLRDSINKVVYRATPGQLQTGLDSLFNY